MRTLSRDVRPRAQVDLLFDPTEGAVFEVPMELTNPTSRTIEVSSWLQSADWRWRSGSEHVHVTIEPGATATWTFHLDRPAHTLDDTGRSTIWPSTNASRRRSVRRCWNWC